VAARVVTNEPAMSATGTSARDSTNVANRPACSRNAASDRADSTNGTGPDLMGVVGRHPASEAGFAYSDGMKKFAEGGKVWDEATLSSYLADPKGVVPGNKMAFPGVKNDGDRANVIAYLKQASQ